MKTSTVHQARKTAREQFRAMVAANITFTITVGKRVAESAGEIGTIGDIVEVMSYTKLAL